MEFKQITLEDKELLDQYLKETSYRGCEYSFMNLMLWGEHYGTEYAIVDNALVFRSGHERKGFYYPVAKNKEDILKALDNLRDYCKETGKTFRLFNVTEKTKEYIEQECPKKYCFQLERANADYIYNQEDLATLKGKKFHGKRNFINRIKDRDWVFEMITSKNMDECIAMNEKWIKQNHVSEDQDKQVEQEVLKKAFENYEALGLVGGLIRLEGEVVAFSIGEPLTEDTIDVHFEKAYSDIDGAYPLINREFAANVAKDFKYINREEDMGVEGLRKAKLSYRPVILLEKYYMTENCDEVEKYDEDEHGEW